MAIDPAKFVVMHERYPQVKGYPEFCAQAVRQLVEAQEPFSAQQLVAYVADLMKKTVERPSAGNFFPSYTQGGVFGKIMDRQGCVRTILDGSYDSNSRWAESTIPAETWRELKDTKVTHDKVTQHKIPLSHMRIEPIPVHRSFGVNKSLEPYVPFRTEEEDALHWALVCGEFDTAMREDVAAEDRKKSALRFYSLISHYVPPERGSSTLVRIALAYLEERVGFDLPLCKIGVDLNVQALFRNPMQFVEDCLNGVFFDAELTSEQVLRWHHRKAVDGLESLAKIEKKKSEPQK